MDENSISKDEYIHIRITKAQKNTIQRAARALGMSMSELIRYVVSGVSVGVLSVETFGSVTKKDTYERIAEHVAITLRLQVEGLGEEPHEDG